MISVYTLAMTKHERLKQLSLLGQLITDPVRIEILDFVAQAPRTVEQIVAALGLPTANVSHHLNRLKSENLVIAQHEGKYRRYSLTAPEILYHLEALYFSMLRMRSDESNEGLWIQPNEMQALSDTPTLLVDIRPSIEFETAHIAGAIHCDPSDIQTLPARISPEWTILAYCRGPWCEYAGDAVQLLRSKGFTAYRFASSARTHPFWEKHIASRIHCL